MLDRKATKLFVMEICDVPDAEFSRFYPVFKNMHTTGLFSRSCAPILPPELELSEYTLFLGQPSEERGNVNDRYLEIAA